MNSTSSKMKQNLKRIIAGAGLAVALPMAAFAQPTPPAAPGADGGRPGMNAPHRGGPGMHEHRGHHGGKHFGGHRHGHHGAAFLRGIQLTEAQRDKVFAIKHANAPKAYELFKAVRKSHEDLRGMATSPNFDEARAKAAIDAGARAKADLALLRVKSDREIFNLLTVEQKAQVEKNRQNFLQHRMSMGERGGPRGPGGPGAPQK